VSNTPNQAQSVFWNNLAGPVWVAEKARLDRFSEHFLQKGLARLAPKAGQRAIDVGCGTGASTLALADAVGSEGRVIGVDICRVMLDAARSALSGHSHVELLEADAQSYRPPAPVDLVFSRFGVMFFDDPPAAFDNLRQAMAIGGQLGFLCWRSREDNEWATLPMAAAAEVIDLPTVDPEAPGPFRMQSGARVVELLMGAGFDDAEVEALDHSMQFSVAEACEFFSRVGPMAAFLREANDATQKELQAALRAAFEARANAEQVQLKAAAWWVSAQRTE
jgi:trans-aconitate methyltransferase